MCKVNGNILAVIYDCFYDTSVIFKQLEGLNVLPQLWHLTPTHSYTGGLHCHFCKKNYNGLLRTFKGKF